MNADEGMGGHISNITVRGIYAEVLQFSTLRDNICPPSTQFAAFNNMTCKKQIKIAPDYSHEFIRTQNDITYSFIIDRLAQKILEDYAINTATASSTSKCKG